MPHVLARDGARIFYRVDGPPRAESLVLIMGLGWDMSGWDLLVPHMRDYRVLRLDNRGTGRSDHPDHAYTMRQMAADVVRCMNAAGIERAHVYGASLGSMIAQELALAFPSRVRSLILGCPSPGVVSFPGSPGLLRLAMGAGRVTPEESFRRAVPYLYGVSRTERPEAIEEVFRRRQASRVDPVGMRRQLAAILSWTSVNRLHTITAPTLVIHGDRDRLIPAINGRLVARLIPGARLHILHGAGHVYGTDRPAEHFAALREFLAEQAEDRLAS